MSAALPPSGSDAREPPQAEGPVAGGGVPQNSSADLQRQVPPAACDSSEASSAAALDRGKPLDVAFQLIQQDEARRLVQPRKKMFKIFVQMREF